MNHSKAGKVDFLDRQEPLLPDQTKQFLKNRNVGSAGTTASRADKTIPQEQEWTIIIKKHLLYAQFSLS